MKIKNISLAKLGIYILSCLVILTGKSFAQNDIMRAMKDEIKRTIEELKVESLQKPYYVEYTLTIRNSHQIKASLGSLVDSNSSKSVRLAVGVRVGNYKMDNTNFFDFGLSFFGSGDDEESFKSRLVPEELDYNTLRRELWLATDAAYKQAAEVYSKKEATLKSRMRKDTTYDFTQMPATKSYDTTAIPSFDYSKYEKMAKEISKIFTKYPGIYTSSANIEYLPETVYYVNSEGREYIKTNLFTGMEIVAATQTDDGMPLSNIFSSYAHTPDELPGFDSLSSAARLVADKLDAAIKAKQLDEPYSGPVLFEGQAAAEAFAQVFAPNLVVQRQPLTEQGVQENDRYGAFQSKIGGRVLPEFMSVSDIPSRRKYENTNLNGNFIVDDEGVTTQDIQLVKDGYLKNLLSSRIPIQRVKASNGHQRGGAPMYSNVELSANKEHVKSHKDLVNQMMKLCKDRELPYGIIVRKLMDANIMYTTLFRMTNGDFPMAGGQGKIPTVEMYKIYPDGKEEMVRGCEVNSLTVQSFKDILNTGDKKYALNLLAPAVTSPFMSGGKQYVEASVIVPDLLFEDCEIKPLEQDFPKPPIISNPLTIDK